MLERELSRLINTGQVVAFIGSGVSSNAGLPSWKGLFTKAEVRIRAGGSVTTQAQQHAAREDFPRAFEALVEASTREAVSNAVREIISTAETPGPFHRLLADWPFRFYVTTNYDCLLEDAARKHHGAHTVGNADAEVRGMLPVDEVDEGFVWHPHGAVSQDAEKSRLIVTASDYDWAYPKSRVCDALEKIASTNRLLFVGFGFADRALLSILNIVRGVQSADKPSYAFVPSTGSAAQDSDTIDRFRLDYNVRVLKYDPEDASHSGLGKALRANACFMRRRSITLGEKRYGAPEYDPVACSLLVHNRLLEGTDADPTADVAAAMSRALILSFLVNNSPTTEANLVAECSSLCGDAVRAVQTIETLVASSHVARTGEEITLTEAGANLVDESSARLNHRREAFTESVRARSAHHDAALPAESLDRVANIAEHFFGRICRKRGLGVAQSLLHEQAGATQLRAAAMLESLPEEFAACDTEAEVLALVHSASGILIDPKPAEATYLGLLSQAYFGAEYLGTGEVHKVDLAHLKSSCFVLDSNVLISALAPASRAGALARRLIVRLVEIGATLVTTKLFLDETTSHWKWAEHEVRNARTNPSTLLQTLAGAHGGSLSEVFEGWLATRDGRDGGGFSTYLRSVIPAGKGRVTGSAVESAVEGMGVSVLRPSSCIGFKATHEKEITSADTQITGARQDRGNYTSNRQTKAEAEVVVLLRGLRRGDLSIPKRPASNVYFISGSALLEDYVGIGGRVTLRPGGLWQWLIASGSFSEDAARTLFQHLLHEFAVDGVEFIPHDLISQRFAGLCEADKRAVRRLSEERRELVAGRLGPDPEGVIARLTVDELSVFAGGLSRDAVESMKTEVERARSQQHRSSLSEKDKAELEQLRAAKRERHRREVSRRRKVESGQHKGARRGRRKGRG